VLPTIKKTLKIKVAPIRALNRSIYVRPRRVTRVEYGHVTYTCT